MNKKVIHFKFNKLSKKKRDKLIFDNLDLVERISIHIFKKINKKIDIEDIRSEGILGLMDAVNKYTPVSGSTFQTYAGYRIKGNIIDFLRSEDIVSRKIRKEITFWNSSKDNFEKEIGRSISLSEFRKLLDMPIDDFFIIYKHLDIKNAILSENINNNENLLDNLSKKDYVEYLKKNINELPNIEKRILSMYFFKNINQKEISNILDLTEARISQLKKRSLVKLKNKLVA